MKDTFKVNNFDLLRLIAATQVALHHSLSFLKTEHSSWMTSMLFKLFFFPGVPVFFFVSGFLISKSYENNSVIKEYVQNRAFRIYPALVVCTLLSVFGVYLSGYFAENHVSLKQILFWASGQVSFLQFNNPKFMRAFGVGVLNGSLWSITVELQFYVLIPILYWLLSLVKPGKKDAFLVVLILVFMAVNQIHHGLEPHYANAALFKLCAVSFLPWFYMFLTGVLFQRSFVRIHRLFHDKFLFVFSVYLTAYAICKYFSWPHSNDVNPPLFLLLAVTVFSFAYSFPTLSGKVLGKNDISYGVYIYHMPVINFFVYYGYTQNVSALLGVLILTLAMAAVSWIFIERPMMKLKRHSLNPLQTVKSSLIGVRKNNGIIRGVDAASSIVSAEVNK